MKVSKLQDDVISTTTIDGEEFTVTDIGYHVYFSQEGEFPGFPFYISGGEESGKQYMIGHCSSTEINFKPGDLVVSVNGNNMIDASRHDYEEWKRRCESNCQISVQVKRYTSKDGRVNFADDGLPFWVAEYPVKEKKCCVIL